MRTAITALAVLTLVACNRGEEPAPANGAEANVTAANAAGSNAAATADFQLNNTTWQFTRAGKATTETIDSSGNYVAWSGAEHIDHGKAWVEDGKACFTSAMTKEGKVCWTTAPTEIGQSFETTSDKGEKLTVMRVELMPVPDNVKP
jgi:hypothetical protein